MENNMLPHKNEHKVSDNFAKVVEGIIDRQEGGEFWDKITDVDNSKEYGLGSYGQVVSEEEELSESKDIYIKPSDTAPNGWEGKFFEIMNDDMDDIGFSGDYLIVPKKLEKKVTELMKKLKVKFTKEDVDLDESVDVDGRTKGFKAAIKRLAGYKEKRDNATQEIKVGSDEVSNDDVSEIVSEGIELNKKQLELLRKKYGSLDKINPTGAAYKKMKAFIGGMDEDQLKGLAFAKIKWLSHTAAMQLDIKHNIQLKAKDYMGS